MVETVITKTKLKSRSTIQSLSRGLTLLEYVVSSDEPVSLGDLAELLGIERSSAHRLMATLLDYGYVIQDSQKRYLPGPAITELACKTAGRVELYDIAGPFLSDLAEQTGETAHLGVYGRGRVILTHCISSRHTLAVTSRVGSSEPLHCTALGKALICDYEREKLKDVLGKQRLKKYTPKTITSLVRLEKECQRICEVGLAVDDEEFRIGIRCLAAPVRDVSRNVVAAIGISGPKDRLDDDTFRQMRELVRTFGIKMSKRLGYIDKRSVQ